jgi:hypothetical protein
MLATAIPEAMASMTASLVLIPGGDSPEVFRTVRELIDLPRDWRGRNE